MAGGNEQMRVGRQGVAASKAGMTLLEIMIAVTIFMVVLGGVAQILISFYAAQLMQSQRLAVAENAKSVFTEMRQHRDQHPDDFPGAVTTRWPDGSVIPGAGTQTNETIRVDYVNTAANPLEITLTSTWVDLHNRTMTMTVSTVLTDR
ncbi:MAG TPA: type II secretion system protein [Candidatus Hydrogenedentes bacterium]|nr:type II secretion system protein [Candidatus Hydrogenedentota bacterium]HPK00396.1 type II secretion system protein [Candidatus Hydrogenedentota bacterium]